MLGAASGGVWPEPSFASAQAQPSVSVCVCVCVCARTQMLGVWELSVANLLQQEEGMLSIFKFLISKSVRSFQKCHSSRGKKIQGLRSHKLPPSHPKG